jgi:hypothetical protein
MTQSQRSLPEALAQALTNSLPAIPTNEDLLAKGYGHWFGPLYAYVSRYVAGRPVRERIVREVLAMDLDLLVGRRDGGLGVRRIEAAADRLIADALKDAELFIERRRPERLSRWRLG